MSRDTVRELVDFMRGNATVTGDRVYFPERKLRELLRSAQEALAQQPTTPEGMVMVDAEDLHTLRDHLKIINSDDDGDYYLNASADALELIDAMLAAAQQEPTT